LLRPRENSPVGWLHSVNNSRLAFPVVATQALAFDYPDVPIEESAKRAGVGGNEPSICLMAVLNVSGAGIDATVNLLAPIIVNVETRQGAQILLEASQYSTREPFMLLSTERDEQVQEAQQNGSLQASATAP
jgi:flagellar assembly factor FliW